jgi:hypothetical protein
MEVPFACPFQNTNHEWDLVDAAFADALRNLTTGGVFIFDIFMAKCDGTWRSFD